MPRESWSIWYNLEVLGCIEWLLADKRASLEAVQGIVRTSTWPLSAIRDGGPALWRLKEVPNGITMNVGEGCIVKLVHWNQI